MLHLLPGTKGIKKGTVLLYGKIFHSSENITLDYLDVDTDIIAIFPKYSSQRKIPSSPFLWDSENDFRAIDRIFSCPKLTSPSFDTTASPFCTNQAALDLFLACGAGRREAMGSHL